MTKKKKYGVELPAHLKKTKKKKKKDSTKSKASMVAQNPSLGTLDPETAQLRELQARRAARERLMQRESAFTNPVESEEEKQKRMRRQEKSKRKADKLRRRQEEEDDKKKRKRDRAYAKKERKMKENPKFWVNPDVKNFMKDALPVYMGIPSRGEVVKPVNQELLDFKKSIKER